MLFFVLFVLVLIAYIVAHYLEQVNYWKKRGVKYVSPLPFVGNLLPIVLKTTSIPEYVIDLYNAYPNERYCGTYQFGRPILLIRDPELIKSITIKDFNSFVDHGLQFNQDLDSTWQKNLIASQGTKWRNLRQTLSPVFTSRKMKTMYVLMEDCTHRLVNYLNDKKNEVIEVEVENLLKRYCMDVIATTAFGIETNSVTESDNEFFKMGVELTDFTGLKRFKFLLYGGVVVHLAKMLNLRMVTERVFHYFHDIIKSTMEIRAKKNILRPDFIHLFMEARKGRLHLDEIRGSSTTNDSESFRDQKELALNLTNEDITAQAMLFIFGGYDTSSKLLTFCLYELAVNPVIQEKLLEEIEANFQKSNGKIEYEDLFTMKYLDMVLSETLRKWPPAVFLDRKAVSPFTIEPAREGERPLHIQAGEVCWIPAFGIHRDPKYWPNPDVFDPDRFNDENREKIHPGTYMPFGLGPRNCIGMRYALMEAKLFIFHFVRNFEIVPVQRSKIPLELSRNNALITTKHGLWFGLKKRRDLEKIQ